jgi:pyridoxine 5-phosphate synthase
MTKLSVNVNKLATLRNSRGKNNPDVVRGSRDIVAFGSQGITVHPRPDERHIRKTDVYALKKAITEELGVELNIEGYPSKDFIAMVEDVRAAQCTLVPDPPEAITSNAGWNISANAEFLTQTTERLRASGTRVSVFVDPYTMKESDYALLTHAGVHRIELYTERYAESFGTPELEAVTAVYRQCSERARAAGLGINAGHDLNLDNLTYLIQEIPWIDEVSIGHALICDALYLGLEIAVNRYLACIRKGSEASLALR